jgi:hypothetical protein
MNLSPFIFEIVFIKFHCRVCFNIENLGSKNEVPFPHYTAMLHDGLLALDQPTFAELMAHCQAIEARVNAIHKSTL